MGASKMVSVQEKTILFFSCEPGGAEVLIPVIRMLSETGFHVVVTGYGHGLHRFTSKGVNCQEISPLQEGDTSLLEAMCPCLVITSATSLPEYDMSDRMLWGGARKLGIPSVAFLDQWQNYGQRFSGNNSGEWLAYFPDYINCINSVAEREMHEIGISLERLVCLGHPYLSELKSKIEGISLAAVREKIKLIDECEVVLFVSEPIGEFFGKTRGYDQFDALKMFLEWLEINPDRTENVILKLHPKDQRSEYEQFLSSYPQFRFHLVSNEVTPIECIALASVVCGMSSIMLIEAATLGKPVVSFQPNLSGTDPLVLSRLRLVPVVTEQAQLSATLASDVLELESHFPINFEHDRFLSFVQDVISHKLDETAIRLQQSQCGPELA